MLLHTCGRANQKMEVLRIALGWTLSSTVTARPRNLTLGLDVVQHVYKIAQPNNNC
jgi:hypothetical protein